jgi:hypothetical protein
MGTALCELGDRRYRARIYTDEPGVAAVIGLGDTETRWSEAPTDPYLRAIPAYLEADVGSMEIRTLGRTGGYSRVVDDGRLRHRRGVTDIPGLSFLGLTWQHTRGSALIG